MINRIQPDARLEWFDPDRSVTIEAVPYSQGKLFLTIRKATDVAVSFDIATNDLRELADSGDALITEKFERMARELGRQPR